MRNILRRLFGGTEKKLPNLAPEKVEPKQEKEERRPLKFPFFWEEGGNQCFITTPKQEQMLVNNLPRHHINSLQMHSFFTEKVPDVAKDTYVDFGITGKYSAAPCIQIRVDGIRPILLNFSVHSKNDPILALAVLYVMYKQCPVAFLVTPCNYESYCKKIFSPEELQCIERLRWIDYHDSVYTTVKNHFSKKGGETLANTHAQHER